MDNQYELIQIIDRPDTCVFRFNNSQLCCLTDFFIGIHAQFKEKLGAEIAKRGPIIVHMAFIGTACVKKRIDDEDCYLTDRIYLTHQFGGLEASVDLNRAIYVHNMKLVELLRSYMDRTNNAFMFINALKVRIRNEGDHFEDN